MPTYLFYPRRADGVSLTFIADSAEDDGEALVLAAEIAATHECVGVFIWEPGAGNGKDRFVGEVDRRGAKGWRDIAPERGAVATV